MVKPKPVNYNLQQIIIMNRINWKFGVTGLALGAIFYALKGIICTKGIIYKKLTKIELRAILEMFYKKLGEV